MFRDGIPVLDAKISPMGTQVWVWCIYCKKHHYHGIDSANGHVVAHCYKETPYSSTGYYLRVAQDEAKHDM